MIALPASFWDKVDMSGGCWLWTGCQNSRGYGCFAVGGKSQLVHRLAYEALAEPIPEGLTLDHLAELCSSTLCVNPDHLEPVTRAENSRRKWRAVTTCRQGHPLTVRRDGHQRLCRPCESARNRARRAERKRAELEQVPA